MSASQAVKALEALHLSAHLTDQEDRTCNNIGSVTYQQPSSGSRVGRDSFVTCYVGSQPKHACP